MRAVGGFDLAVFLQGGILSGVFNTLLCLLVLGKSAIAWRSTNVPIFRYQAGIFVSLQYCAGKKPGRLRSVANVTTA
jgi:hypothetical protein